MAVFVSASGGSSCFGKSICPSPPGGVGLGVGFGVGDGVGVADGVGVGNGNGVGKGVGFGKGVGVGIGGGVGLGGGVGIGVGVGLGSGVSVRTRYQLFGSGVRGVLSPRRLSYLKVPASTILLGNSKPLV